MSTLAEQIAEIEAALDYRANRSNIAILADALVSLRSLEAQSDEVRRLKDLLRKARTFVSWHTRPEPEDVKPELREIDAALGSQP